MSNSEANNVSIGTAAMIVGGVASTIFGGGEVFGNIISNSLSFYTEMYMYRIVAKLIQPMVLMGIFMFWAIYVLVAQFRWREVFQGLTIIIVITLFPSIWAIADHMDSSIYQAMYPDLKIESLGERADRNKAERIVLDMASTVFYIIFPLILVYIVGAAGGARVNGAVDGIDSQSRGIGKTSGSMTGQTGSVAIKESKREYREAKRRKKEG